MDAPLAKSVARIGRLALSLAVLAGAAYLLWKGLLFALPKLKLANANVSAAVITALALIGGLIWDRHAERARAKREQLLPVFEALVDNLFRIAGATANAPGAEALSPEQLFQAWQEFAKKAVVWGSSDVIKVWRRYQDAVSSGGHDRDEQAVLEALSDLLLSLRSEVGHADKNLTRADVIAVLVGHLDTTVTSHE